MILTDAPILAPLRAPQSEAERLIRALEKLTPGDSVSLDTAKSGDVFKKSMFGGPAISMDDRGELYFSSVDDTIQLGAQDGSSSPAVGSTVSPGAIIRILREQGDALEISIPTPFIRKHLENSDLPEKPSRVASAPQEELVLDASALKMLLRAALGPVSTVEKPTLLPLSDFPDGEPVTVGREGSKGFVVHGSAVSRKHLEVTLLPCGYLQVKDTSTFGTEQHDGKNWIRLPKHESTMLAPGTLLRLGGNSGEIVLLGSSSGGGALRSSAA